MKAATHARNERILYAVLSVFVLGACVFIYEYVFATPTTSTSAPAVSSRQPAEPDGNAAAGAQTAGRAAKSVGTTSENLDPTLHMEAMLVSESVQYSGSGRNIFSANSAPVVPIPAPVAPARLKTAEAQKPTPPPAPTGPPPPPPIDLKFFGYETTGDGARYAFLLHNDEVFRASPGDVVLRRYRVISIDAKSIQVEDMQFNDRQTLPLLAN